MTASYLAAIGHPAVKAIAPLFVPVDIYEDLVAPGGLFCSGFIDMYNVFVKALETGRLSDIVPIVPKSLSFQLLKLCAGVLPVTGHEDLLVGTPIKPHAQAISTCVCTSIDATNM
jgi:hypothetical protein